MSARFAARDELAIVTEGDNPCGVTVRLRNHLGENRDRCVGDQDRGFVAGDTIATDAAAVSGSPNGEGVECGADIGDGDGLGHGARSLPGP